MARDWAAVEDLMRDLGAVRRAADSLRADDAARLALERAITEAAEAVDRTINAPKNDERLSNARRAIGVAMEVVLALDKEIGRSLRIRSRAEALSAHAAQLIQRANRDQRIRFATRRPHDHEQIAASLNPLAQAGYTVKIGAAPDAETWLVAVEKRGRNTSFRVPRNASSYEWQEAVQRVLGFDLE
jgi:hypothetical protein